MYSLNVTSVTQSSVDIYFVQKIRSGYRQNVLLTKDCDLELISIMLYPSMLFVDKGVSFHILGMGNDVAHPFLGKEIDGKLK